MRANMLSLWLSRCSQQGSLPVTQHQHARRAEPPRQPACCLPGWPAAGAPARRGMVPVARGDMGGVLG
jgi:hypothetical protein